MSSAEGGIRQNDLERHRNCHPALPDSDTWSGPQHEDVEFFYPDQIYERYAPDILKRDSLPGLLSARVNWYGYRETEGTIPDGLFMLRFPQLPEGKNRRFIFLEIDRGTETIDVSERKSKTLKFWKDTSVLRKFVVYAYAWKTGAHKRQFGIPTFQVLTVTTNSRRVAAMQRMYRKRLAGRPHSVPPARFLFADHQAVWRPSQTDAIAVEDGGTREHRLLGG